MPRRNGYLNIRQESRNRLTLLGSDHPFPLAVLPDRPDNPEDGMFYANTTLQVFEYYFTATGWQVLGASGGSGPGSSLAPRVTALEITFMSHIDGPDSHPASDISYDGSSSGSSQTDVQGFLDEYEALWGRDGALGAQAGNLRASTISLKGGSGSGFTLNVSASALSVVDNTGLSTIKLQVKSDEVWCNNPMLFFDVPTPGAPVDGHVYHNGTDEEFYVRLGGVWYGMSGKDQDAALATHEAAADPHPQYLTPAEGDAAYQPLDEELTALAALSSQADRVPYFTGVATAALAMLTSFGRSLIAAVDAAAARLLLGLGTLSTQNANAVNIDGGEIDETPIGAATADTGDFTDLTADTGDFTDLTADTGDITDLTAETIETLFIEAVAMETSYLDIALTADPGSPSAGKARLWFDGTDLWAQDSTGTNVSVANFP